MVIPYDYLCHVYVYYNDYIVSKALTRAICDRMLFRDLNAPPEVSLNTVFILC